MADEGKSGFNRRDVERSLEAVLTSEQFSGSPQLSDFLSFIVTKTLDGQKSDIKAYTIAVDALGRGEDFDPQTNAAVRVAAGRLRQALSLYNSQDGEFDSPVKIILSAGSYVPTFESNIPESEALEAKLPEVPPLPERKKFDLKRLWVRCLILLPLFFAALLIAYFFLGPARDEPEETAAPSNGSSERSELAVVDVNRRPIIRATVFMPDAPYPGWFKDGEVVDSIGVAIARFDDYQFIGVTEGSPTTTQKDAIADYNVIVTAYRRDEQVSMFANLIRERDNTTIWSMQRTFERPPKLSERSVIDIAGRAFAPVGSPYGVIYTDLLNSGGNRKQLECTIATYQYFSTKTDAGHKNARDCAEKSVELGSQLPSIYAALTFLYLDEHREGRNRRDRDPVQAAKRMAGRAVELGPQSARAHQAEFAVHKVQGHRPLARTAAEQALQLNPYDTDIIGDYAAWLISIGDNEQGRALLNKAVEMLRARPAWLEFYRFLAAELDGDFQTADQVSVMLDMRRSPLLAIAVAIGAHRRGNVDEARAAIDELVKIAPDFKKNPRQSFIRRGFDETIADGLVSKLVAAGMAIESTSED